MATKTVMTFNNRLTAFRCINNSDSDVYGEVTLDQNGRTYGKTFLAHTETYQAIPTGAAQKIQFDSVGPHGNFTGLTFSYRG